jgi:putative nucleotidyltransferase with HDIG domain
MNMENYSNSFEVLNKYMQKPNLLKHSMAVEATMRHFADMLGFDAERWGAIGLLHDVDFELYPAEHCYKTEELLSPEGYDADFIRAIKSHGHGLCTDVLPETIMEKVLACVDQLTGFLTACALILPTKSLADVAMPSVMKKWGKKDFAAGTGRERCEYWAGALGKTIEYMLEQTLIAMRGIADKLGL